MKIRWCYGVIGLLMAAVPVRAEPPVQPEFSGAEVAAICKYLDHVILIHRHGAIDALAEQWKATALHNAGSYFALIQQEAMCGVNNSVTIKKLSTGLSLQMFPRK